MFFYCIGGIPVTNELYHHGIKGQKWGIRRYQNLDGTLTAAGKERYGKDISDISDNKMRRQILRNQQWNGIRQNSHYAKEAKSTRKLISDLRQLEKTRDFEEMRKRGEAYIKEIAAIRLASMGYEVNKNNVSLLSGKKWFRNLTWVTNTLASMGTSDVDYTTRDDWR